LKRSLIASFFESERQLVLTSRSLPNVIIPPPLLAEKIDMVADIEPSQPSVPASLLPAPPLGLPSGPSFEETMRHF